MNKIAVVGAGNAGCITALQTYDNFGDECEISIYHNLDRYSIERVGQGTIVNPTELISSVLDIDWYNNPIGATIKSGVLYEGWGKKNEKIFHRFTMDTMAMHFVPEKLTDYVLGSGKFKVIEGNIDDPEREIDADLIFDCRGRHNRDLTNYESLINPLNSVLLSNKKGKDHDLTYTRTVATPNGWTFIIPNQDSVSYGYLYNDTITSNQEAVKDFLERFNLFEIDGDLKFDSYMAKDMFSGERTVLQGNMYGFLEPMEATALYLYQGLCNRALDSFFNDDDRTECNNDIRLWMKQLEIFILWHYQFGSKYDTPFWHYAKSLSFNPDSQFKYIIDNLDHLIDADEYDDYGQWGPDSFRIWRDGVT